MGRSGEMLTVMSIIKEPVDPEYCKPHYVPECLANPAYCKISIEYTLARYIYNKGYDLFTISFQPRKVNVNAPFAVGPCRICYDCLNHY